MSHLRAVVGAAVAVLRRPSLWPTALRQIVILARPGWWRRLPFLPLPPTGYLRFRLQTAYGGDGDVRAVRSEDVVAYLVWSRSWQLWRRQRAGRT